MKIAVVGTGKMGAAVAREAVRAGHTITAEIGGAENREPRGLTRERLGGADVAIEFTRPETAVPNLMRLIELGLPVVTGTTGWYDELPTMETTVRAANGTLLYGPNFSIGAAVFEATAAALAKRLATRPEFDCAIAETHHRQKRDAPSGTARSIQGAIRAVDPAHEYPIHSTRLGFVPGTHAVIADGAYETIELVHTVRDRAVFAQGAILAAEWLAGRRGFYHFHELLGGSSR